jgi:hypothetical protein
MKTNFSVRVMTYPPAASPVLAPGASVGVRRDLPKWEGGLSPDELASSPWGRAGERICVSVCRVMSVSLAEEYTGKFSHVSFITIKVFACASCYTPRKKIKRFQ